MIRNIVTGIMVVAVLSGCSNSVKDELITKVGEECGITGKSGCTIVLKDITKFKWDEMYFFADWTTSDTIAKVVGFDYYGADVPDDYTRMLFTYNNKVVYEEDFKMLNNDNLTIDFPEVEDSLFKGKPYYLKATEAIFKAERGKIDVNCKKCLYYNLMR